MPTLSLRDLDPAARFELLSRLARRVGRSLRSRKDVLFVGFGRRHKRNQVGHEWCIKVYVPRKLKTVPKRRRIPESYRTSAVVDAKRRQFLVGTDVHELPKFRATRPLADPVGSVHNEKDPPNWGTITAVVRLGSTGRTYLLSAAHVLARNESTTSAQPGERIFDMTGGLVGTLFKAANVQAGGVDAALCTADLPDPSVVLQRGEFGPVTQICPVGQVAADGIDFTMLSWIDDRYMCFYGFIPDFPVTGYAGGDVVIPLVIHFGCAADGGDSGALVIDSRGRAVGMHLWGREETDSYCIPIETVLNDGFAPDTLTLLQ